MKSNTSPPKHWEARAGIRQSRGRRGTIGREGRKIDAWTIGKINKLNHSHLGRVEGRTGNKDSEWEHLSKKLAGKDRKDAEAGIHIGERCSTPLSSALTVAHVIAASWEGKLVRIVQERRGTGLKGKSGGMPCSVCAWGTVETRIK